MERDVRDVCREHPEALGIAVIVANRRGYLREQAVLTNVHIDQENMRSAFEALGFAVLCATDIGKDVMMTLFGRVASFDGYPRSYRRLAVVFAGHGIGGALCTHDGIVPVNDILDQFQPASCHPSIAGIPKLFFIDACRGDLQMSVMFTERGGEVVPSKTVTRYGNSLVAYSTLLGYKAYEVAGKGGIWLSRLSTKLRQDKSILDVMTDVNEAIMAELQQVAFHPYAQQPTCEHSLNETVNLFRESRGRAGPSLHPSVPPIVPAGRTGSRPLQEMLHGIDRCCSNTRGSPQGGLPADQNTNYRKELNEWSQREGIEVPRKFEESSNPQNHKCTIAVRKKQFSSGWYPKKKDAEEEAAKMAVQWIRQQQPTPCVARSLSSSGGNSKPGKARLKEYLDHHTELQMTANYFVPLQSSSPFQCTLTLTSPSKGQLRFTGGPSAAVRDAEHDAADKAVLKLEREYGP